MQDEPRLFLIVKHQWQSAGARQRIAAGPLSPQDAAHGLPELCQTAVKWRSLTALRLQIARQRPARRLPECCRKMPATPVGASEQHVE
jgi:hypothetical protein